MPPGAVKPGIITGIVKADGADLYVERRGDGPPLLMIAGGHDLRHDPFHRQWAAIAARLAAQFAEIPGGYQAPTELPAPFAARVRDVFGRL
jgi:hypothetical protein